MVIECAWHTVKKGNRPVCAGWQISIIEVTGDDPNVAQNASDTLATPKTIGFTTGCNIWSNQLKLPLLLAQDNLDSMQHYGELANEMGQSGGTRKVRAESVPTAGTCGSKQC